METPKAESGGSVATPAGSSGADFRTTAAAAVAPDPVTAELLAKHSAGKKLTQPEYGKLGAWKARLKAIWDGKGGKDGPAVGQAQPASPPGHAPALAPLAPVEAPDGSLAPVPIDAGLARRTTAVVLARCDAIAVRYIGNAARQAGAAGEALARLERDAALSKDDKALMVEIAPDVFTALGINPRHFPVVVFFGTFGAWATNLWLVVEELKALKESKKVEPEKQAGGKP